MEFKLVLLCSLSLVCLYPARVGGHLVTVCPEDYSPRDDCVTIYKLLSNRSLIQSNTTIQFVPATIKVKSETIISIANVSNITLETVDSDRANLSCTGENSGFLVYNVSEMTIKNINFIDCGAERILITHYPLFHESVILVALAITDSADIVLDNIAFYHGKGGGILAADVYGNFTVSNTLFTQMQSTCFSLIYRSLSNKYSTSSSPPFVNLSNSEFISNYFTKYNDFKASEIGVLLHNSQFNVSLHVENVIASNNTLTKNVSGISIVSSAKLAKHHIIIQRYSRKNNVAVNSFSSDFYYFDFNSHEKSVTMELVDCSFINNSIQDDNNKDRFDIFFDYPPSVFRNYFLFG